MDESTTMTVGVDRVDLDATLAALGMRTPSACSPLVDLMAADATTGRLADELDRHDATRLAAALAPLIAPDRVLDMYVAAFESAPVPARLCTSRRVGAGWAGVRTAIHHELELIAQLTDDDLVRWARLHLESSAGAPIPAPWDLLTGNELAFLCAVLDAHAQRAHGAFTHRRPQPAPVVVHLSDIVEAQLDALRVRDRRWLSTALLELFDLLVHPGGRRGVGLPPVTAELARSEVNRYVERGWLEVIAGGANPGLRLAGPLLAVAATLGGWLQLVCLHDTQITGWVDGRALVQHDAVVLIVAPAATWALSTVGLGRARDDLTDVEFRLHTVNVVTGERLVRAVLAALPAEELPDECYAPAPAPTPVTTPSPIGAQLPPPPPPVALPPPGAADGGRSLPGPSPLPPP